jgi:hypothetical protein
MVISHVVSNGRMPFTRGPEACYPLTSHIVEELHMDKVKSSYFVVAAAATGLVALLGAANPLPAAIYAKGEFNGWGTANEMTETAPGSGHYVTTVTGLTAGTTEFKINDTVADAWNPSSNAKVVVDATGSITFHYYPGTINDGYQPTTNRVGYDDPGHGWDVMGSFNGWASPLDMSTTGNGVYTATVTVPTAGTALDFKFRKDDDWGVSIGSDFGNSAANATYTTTTADEQVQFILDLPGGRWDAVAVTAPVPEPASLGLLGVGALCVLRRRRERRTATTV